MSEDLLRQTLQGLPWRTGRVLVTASRDWDQQRVLWDALQLVEMHTPFALLPDGLTLVHGDAAGGDRMAARWVQGRQFFPSDLGPPRRMWQVDPHPVTSVDWERLGRRAGMERNARMVGVGADLCLAFINVCQKGRDCPVRPGVWHGSHGATGCADLAQRAGIPTVRFYGPGYEQPAPRSAAAVLPGMRPHEFAAPDLINGSPVLRCVNTPCRVVWWPDRNRPADTCRGDTRG